MNLQQLQEKIAAAGVVGAGGAGFPTAMKMAVGADSLIINGAECEPLIFTDYHILRTQREVVFAGARAIMEATGIRTAYLAIKAHTAQRFQVSDGDELAPHIQVAVLPNVYPMGDEVILTYQVLHRVVQPGTLPIKVGVIVDNVETVYNIGRAVQDVPVTEKWLTVTGQVETPKTICVPVGTPVKELFRRLNVTVPQDSVVLDGGPAMGKIIDWQTASVTKTTKGILILPDTIPAVTSKRGAVSQQIKRASSVCCQCTLCTEICPRQLLGYDLQPHKTVRAVGSQISASPEDFLTASMCCGCGICDLVACCQGILPRMVMTEVKGVLAKNKLKYQAKEPAVPHPDRDMRLLPNRRFKALIGVAPFDRQVAVLMEDKLNFAKVTLPTKMHVGAPAVPIVKKGDKVVMGQTVAQASGPVSAGIHASISGTVTRVDEKSITIEE